MSDRTGIEWCDATWNIVTGCTKVSPGCAHCYAERDFHRPYPGRDFRDVHLHYDRMDWPLRARKPRRIFPCSLSDLFHDAVPDSFILGAIAVMANADQHTFLVLTKRAERMQSIFHRLRWKAGLGFCQISGRNNLLARLPYFDNLKPWEPLFKDQGGRGPTEMPDFVPPNIWGGVSVEDRRRRDERLPVLLKTRVAHKFVSIEPLLEDIAEPEGFSPYLYSGYEIGPQTDRLEWVIVGGESGPKARPIHPDWVRALRNDCQAAKVPFFFKQWGEWTPGENVNRTRGCVATATWFGGQWRVGGIDLARTDGHVDDEPDLYRVGKKAAGCLLDGVEWKQFPEVSRG